MKSKKLTELLENYYSISIIGMSKNAGKTTVLNKLISEYDNNCIKVGITSIGRDGEDVDIVTGTEKPRIFVTRGTIIATAADLLKKSDITKEIMLTTGINTPMGEVVFVQARSDGYVQIGGSSIGTQIVKLLGNFSKLGADKVFIDGAFSRKTLSNPVICDAVILSSGASYSTDMNKVVNKTVFTANLLMCNALNNRSILDLIEKLSENEGKIIAIRPDCSYFPVNLDNLKYMDGDISHVFVRGAISDRLVDKLIMSNIFMKGVSIIAEDGSKLLISEKTFEKLVRGGMEVVVMRPVNLIAVTVNPVSVSGFAFDKDAFKEALAERLVIPVYNMADAGGVAL